jgi:hypothetical protein
MEKNVCHRDKKGRMEELDWSSLHPPIKHPKTGRWALNQCTSWPDINLTIRNLNIAAQVYGIHTLPKEWKLEVGSPR